MEILNKVRAKVADLVLVWLKSRNKNVIVTKRLAGYVNGLAHQSMVPSMGEEYKRITSSVHGSYQTPISEIKLLELLASSVKAKRILEVGTFKGFTAMCLAMSGDNDTHVWTCEKNKDYASEAHELWEKYHVANKITLLEGDALSTLRSLDKQKTTFDFIYIDADKSNYENYYHEALRLCKKGGLIIVDNALWAGLVAEPHTKYSHARLINQLNTEIFSSKTNKCVMIPAWDGVAIIYVN